MEDALIVEQNECAKRTPNENTLLWIERFTSEYEKLSETSSTVEAFRSLSTLKNEIKQRLEEAKNSIDTYSGQLSSILIDENTMDKNSELFHLHHNISLTVKHAFTSMTFGNFRYGGMHLDKSKKEVARIKKEFPQALDTITNLYEMARKYITLTKQKGKGGIISRIPKAYEVRFLADKLHYQEIALNILLDRILLYDYPNELPTLTVSDKEKLNKFLYEKTKQNKSTSYELYNDIYDLIKRNQQSTEEYLFRKGELNSSALATYALDPEGDEQKFAKKWKKTSKNKKGVSKSWLEKKIREIYVEVIQS